MKFPQYLFVILIVSFLTVYEIWKSENYCRINVYIQTLTNETRWLSIKRNFVVQTDHCYQMYHYSKVSEDMKCYLQPKKVIAFPYAFYSLWCMKKNKDIKNTRSIIWYATCIFYMNLIFGKAKLKTMLISIKPEN